MTLAPTNEAIRCEIMWKEPWKVKVTTMIVEAYIAYAESDNLPVDVLPAGSLQVDVLLVCRQTAS
jgi:hypothetical protein